MHEGLRLKLLALHQIFNAILFKKERKRAMQRRFPRERMVSKKEASQRGVDVKICQERDGGERRGKRV